MVEKVALAYWTNLARLSKSRRQGVGRRAVRRRDADRGQAKTREVPEFFVGANETTKGVCRKLPSPAVFAEPKAVSHGSV